MDITDEMAEKMTLLKGTNEQENQFRTECLTKLAYCCECTVTVQRLCDARSKIVGKYQSCMNYISRAGG